jgi:protease-4
MCLGWNEGGIALSGRAWILILVLAVVVAGVVAIFLLASLGTVFSRGQPLAFGDRVGIIEVVGTIVVSTPTVEQIREFGEDDGIRAIVFRVESPGGGVAAAQEIYSELVKVRDQGKPIVASMGGVAASGGYYVACGADSIVANPGTLTGSIGVIMSLPNAEELFKKIGLKYEVIKTGKYKDIGSPSRPMTPDERILLEDMLDDILDQFVTVVSNERHMRKEAVSEIADGRVMSGRQAMELGLVDRMGDLRDAVMLAGEMAGIKGEPVVVRPRRRTISIWDILENLLSSASALGPQGVSLEYSFK